MEQKILKAVLLLRKVGNTYQSKEEQRAEVRQWIAEGYMTEASLDEWIADLKEELVKTPEQIEEESRMRREWEEKWEMEEATRIAEAFYGTRYDRDEWDDLWADRARECGAVAF